MRSPRWGLRGRGREINHEGTSWDASCNGDVTVHELVLSTSRAPVILNAHFAEGILFLRGFLFLCEDMTEGGHLANPVICHSVWFGYECWILLVRSLVKFCVCGIC